MAAPRIWAGTFIGLGYLLGEQWKAVEANIHHYMLGFTIAAVILVAAYLVWRKWFRTPRN